MPLLNLLSLWNNDFEKKTYLVSNLISFIQSQKGWPDDDITVNAATNTSSINNRKKLSSSMWITSSILQLLYALIERVIVD